MRKGLALSIAAVVGTACGISRGVRPIGDGNSAVSVSAGGPMANYIGTKLPLPLATVGGVYGLSDRVDVHGGLHLTTPAFFGLWGVEMGSGVLLRDQTHPAIPALMADVNLNFFYGNLGEGDPEGGARVFPETDLRASWEWGKALHLAYTGPSAFFSLEPQSLTPAWVVGNQFRFDRTDVTLETRWNRPGADPDSVFVEWGGLAGRGVLSAHLGFRYRFGAKAPPSKPSPEGSVPLEAWTGERQ